MTWSFLTFTAWWRGDRPPKGDIEEEGVLTREEFAAHMMENPADFITVCCGTSCTAGILWKSISYAWIRDISWCEDFMFNLEYIPLCESILCPCMRPFIIM